jgi:Dyp-type peroxidase family
MGVNAPTDVASDERPDIQGLVASAYRHLPSTAYLFLNFPDAVGARDWLRALHPDVSTAAPWPTGPDGRTQKPPTAVNVALTFAGLRALGLSAAALCTFPPELREGMAHPDRARILGDTEESSPLTWELGGAEDGAGATAREIHALLVLHAGSAEALAAFRDDERRRLALFPGITEIVGSAQEGRRPADNKEPFGFRDGIAQPGIVGIDGSGVATGEFILGYADHYGFAPAGPLVPSAEDAQGLLPADPNPHHAPGEYHDLGRNGSYLVYRKLRQDVAGFWRFAVAEARRDRGHADPLHAVHLAAKLVGRWPTGAPLTLAPERDDRHLADRDDFAYASDAAGLGCPMGSHVRRTNPRDVLPPCGPSEALSISAAHRLIRRGRMFGPPLFDTSLLDEATDAGRLDLLEHIEDDGQPRGVHFVALCASLRRQFEFVQQTWVNNARFGGLTDSKDAVTGDNGRPGATPSVMTIPRRSLRWRTSALPRFVTVRGGAYFFLPGLRALRFLSGRG